MPLGYGSVDFSTGNTPAQASSSSAGPSRGGTNYSDVKPNVHNNTDKGKNRASHFIDSDSDEDGVVALSNDEIPAELRKVTNKDNPYVLDDADTLPASRPGSSLTAQRVSRPITRGTATSPITIILDRQSIPVKGICAGHTRPSSWVANEIAHMMNEIDARANKSHRRPVDPSRPRLADLVNALQDERMPCIMQEMHLVAQIRDHRNVS